MEIDITRGFPPPIQKTNRPRISSWFLWQGSSSLVVQLSQLVICKFLVKHLEEMNPEQRSPVVTMGKPILSHGHPWWLDDTRGVPWLRNPHRSVDFCHLIDHYWTEGHQLYGSTGKKVNLIAKNVEVCPWNECIYIYIYHPCRWFELILIAEIDVHVFSDDFPFVHFAGGNTAWHMT